MDLTPVHSIIPILGFGRPVLNDLTAFPLPYCSVSFSCTDLYHEPGAFPGLQGGCKFPRLWALLHCVPRLLVPIWNSGIFKAMT